MRSTLLALAVLAIALAGCGGGKKSDSDQIRSTWQSALNAVGSSEPGSLCTLMTSDAQAQVSAQSHIPCADTVKLLASRLSPAQRKAASHAQITRLVVKGDTATLDFKSTPALEGLGLRGTATLRKVAGKWLLSGL